MSACSAVQERLDWGGIIERIRIGKGGAADLERALRPGLRLLISRKTLGRNAEGVISSVVDEVIAAIRKGSANTAGEVARAARMALNATVERAAALPAERGREDAPHSWMRAFTGTDFEALQRFYSGTESVVEICTRLNMSREEFDAVRQRARSQAPTAAPRAH